MSFLPALGMLAGAMFVAMRGDRYIPAFPNPVDGAQAAGKCIRAFLRRPASDDLLPASANGWDEGGCRMLARAVASAFGGEVWTAVRMSDDAPTHYVAFLDGYVVDGISVTLPESFPAAWRRRMLAVDDVANSEVYLVDRELPSGEIPTHAATERKIRDALLEACSTSNPIDNWRTLLGHYNVSLLPDDLAELLDAAEDLVPLGDCIGRRSTVCFGAWARRLRYEGLITYSELRRVLDAVRSMSDQNPSGYPLLPLQTVLGWEPVAADMGVSEVARSGRGFVRAYERHGANLPEAWVRKRDGFVARHMAQMESEALWDEEGMPTRRHLALIMWAYSPVPDELPQPNPVDPRAIVAAQNVDTVTPDTIRRRIKRLAPNRYPRIEIAEGLAAVRWAEDDGWHEVSVPVEMKTSRPSKVERLRALRKLYVAVVEEGF